MSDSLVSISQMNQHAGNRLAFVPKQLTGIRTVQIVIKIHILASNFTCRLLFFPEGQNEQRQTRGNVCVSAVKLRTLKAPVQHGKHWPLEGITETSPE